MRYNSSKNQKIKGKFVENNVYTCFSYEMDAILKASTEFKTTLPSLDDIENLTIECEKCHGRGCIECDDGYIIKEILEWWIVSEQLYYKLKKYDEPVLEFGDNFYWGRYTSGQAILLDCVINQIAADMQILEGQEYEWNV